MGKEIVLYLLSKDIYWSGDLSEKNDIDKQKGLWRHYTLENFER